jgi:hypothetical protein
MATPSLGDVYVDVHANTDEFEPELKRGLEDAAREAEGGADNAGRDLGDSMADSMADELKRHGKDLGDAIEFSVRGRRLTFRPRVHYDVRDSRGRFAKVITDEIEEAVAGAAGPNGPFRRLGEAFADAIGASFNISGRSPLIALLVPVIGAIVGLVVAALQTVSVLGAALATLPALLGSIALQAGVTALAFDGMGKALSLAFAAENPQQVLEAIKDLAPAAQTFVRSLLPLEDLFRDLKFIAQQNFFKAFGTNLAATIRVLEPLLRGGFAQTATAMGNLFAQLTAFFRSPTFVSFLSDVIPATTRWLERFGPRFTTFLMGLIALADAAIPFLEDMGNIVTNELALVGEKLLAISQDESFQQWLDRMASTLGTVFELLFQATGFIVTFLGELDKAGGQAVIQELADAFSLLTFVLASPVGQKAMEGIVNLAIIGIKVFTGLVITILALIGAFEFMAEAIGAFLAWVVPAIRDAFYAMGKVVSDFFNWLLGGTKNMVVGAMENVDRLVATARALPNRIINAIGNLGQRMYNAGKNALLGLIRGIRDQFGALWNAMKDAMGIVGGFLTNSPAKYGPLSGRGAPEARGRRLVDDFAAGMLAEIPNLRSTSSEVTSSVVFGPNSIQMQFHGPVPTQSQARGVGAAVGSSAAGIIAQRNTRLAVRAL